MTALRVLVGLLGLAAATYGALTLLDLGVRNLVDTTLWLLGGVLLHDVVLAPLTIGLGVLVAALLRDRPLPRWAGPFVGAGVVLGTVTLVAVPVLGRFGARPDNPTLLDRPYVLGWLVLAALTLLGAAATAAFRGRLDVLARHTTKGGDDGSGPGRR